MLERLRFEADAEKLARERGWVVRASTPARSNRVDVSRTSAAGVAAMLAAVGHHLDEHQAATKRGKSAADVERYYRALHSVTRYETPSTFTCELPDALIAGDQGIVVSAEGDVLVQSSLYGGARGARVALALEADAVRSPQRLAGKYVSLVSFDAGNYAHWLLDCLPRLDLLSPDDSSWSVLVPQDVRPFQLESLRLLGIADERIVAMPAGAIRVESLLFARVAGRTTRPAPEHLLAIRRRLLDGAGAGGEGGDRRLYVSRGGASRAVVDEARLAPALEAHGFEQIHPETLPLAEQIRTFAGARAVLGPHGAGMHNHLFAPAGADVIELFGRGYLYLTVQRAVAIAGQRHWHLFGEPAGEEYATRVDPAELLDLLALVFDV